MTTWLTRSLVFIVGGAVLAFAVTTRTLTYHSTTHSATLDVRAAGVILLLVGVFDLLLNFGVSMYLRGTGQPLDPYVANPATTALGAQQPVVTRQLLATTPYVAPQPIAQPDPQPVPQPVYVQPTQPIHQTQPIPPVAGS